MTLRLVSRLDGYTLTSDRALPSGDEWKETLGDFKGLQRAINAYTENRGGDELVVVDGQIGPLTMAALMPVLSHVAWSGGTDVGSVASRARELAVLICRRLGIEPDFRPDQLSTDYRGVASPQFPQQTPPRPAEPPQEAMVPRQDETPAPAPKPTTEQGSGAGKVFIAVAALGGTWALYRWWKKRRGGSLRFAELDDLGSDDEGLEDDLEGG